MRVKAVEYNWSRREGITRNESGTGLRGMIGYSFIKGVFLLTIMGKPLKGFKEGRSIIRFTP